MADGEHDASIVAIERAMDWGFAQVLVLAGARAGDRSRPSSHAIGSVLCSAAPRWLRLAYYLLKQHSQALAPSRECAARRRFGHLCLAAALAQLGRRNEAPAEAAQVLRIDPNWTTRSGARLVPLKHPEDAEHFFDSLLKAGLPD
jgi:hypothetical protein